MIRLFAGLVVVLGVLIAPAAEWVNMGVDFRGKPIEAHPTRVLAKLKRNQNLANLGQAAPDVAVRRAYSEIPQLVVLEMKDLAGLQASVSGNPDPAAGLKKTIKQLKATGLFDYVEPDYVQHADLTPTDARFGDGTLWGLNNVGQNGGVAGADIDVIRGWDFTTGDTNLVVAVIDTGVNYLHRDLAAQMWRNPKEIPGNNIDDDNNGFVDDVFGINSITDTGDPLDDAGHGSHCAGTIGAAANDGNGHVGVIWKVRIMALKFLGADGSGVDSDAIQCINYALSQNVKISNNSWGGGGFDPALFDAISAARARGHLFLAAAGNDGSDNDVNPSYPSGYDLDNIVAVAALDRRDRLADFSNYGLKTVDIGAPGVQIYSTYMGSPTAYAFLDGTSMATPHVTGGAALMWAAEPGADYLRIRERLLQKTIPIPALAGKVSTGGRMSVFNSIRGAADGILELGTVPPAGTAFKTNSQQVIKVRVTDDFLVNNATVVGRFQNANVTFVNTGQAPDTNANDGLYTAVLTMPSTVGSVTLSIDASAPAKQAAHLDVSFLVLPAPPNDLFANATKFPAGGGIREEDNRLATPEPGSLPGDPNYGTDTGEPQHAGVSNVRSLWWSWSTATATPVIIDAAGTSFDDDAVLAVYTGASVSQLTEVASATSTANGANGTRAPFVKFVAQPNLTYRIAVAQTQLGTNSPGRVVLRLEPNGDIDTTPPTVRILNYLSGQVIRQATNVIQITGTSEDPEPNASGVAAVQIKGPNDQVFRTVNGTTNWNSGPMQLAEGANLIQFTAFDRADNQAGVRTITLWYSPVLEYNDLFGKADNMFRTNPIVANNAAASKENNELGIHGNEGGHSLWWYFVPGTNGIMEITTEGSSFDTLLGLYSVAADDESIFLTDLQLVEDNDDVPGSPTGHSQVRQAITAGKIYFVAVDGFGGATGTVRLSYSFTAFPSFPVTLSAGPNGSISPTSRDVPQDAALTVLGTPENRFFQFSAFRVSSAGSTPFRVTTNPFTFIVSAPTEIVAEFVPKVFTDDFERPGFPPLSYTNIGGWEIQPDSVNGVSSRVARTRPNSLNNSTNRLILTTNLVGNAFGSFDFRINTETNADMVQFLINGTLKETWSGQIGWTNYTFQVPASGATNLEWRFKKDLSISVGEDAFFMDNLDLPILGAIPNEPISISLNSSPAEIMVSGPVGANLSLESSTTMAPNSWVGSGTPQTIGSDGRANFTVPALTDTQRFYRVRRTN